MSFHPPTEGELARIGHKLADLGWKNATTDQAGNLPLGSEQLRMRVSELIVHQEDVLHMSPDVCLLYAIRAGENTTPRWLNKVLDTALTHAEIFQFATENGYITAQDWAGLYSVAKQRKKTAAAYKTQELIRILNSESEEN
ncbi:hypothetical protein CMUST_07395 [Corynebacterium mustelae]|uniref:Uncharacterized protein n=1 Tax=Corynebacterium mustelae TaxID=571915 RepID=A0A0G3H1X0_9CORY|nr:hypothetical protein [Corynebacterium mustelae]AKK05808.1 hypothetical protein CMUST_07395 [Corynebacterium mustelae]